MTGARSRAVPPPVPVAVPRTAFVVLVLLLVVGGVAGVLVLHTKINENAFQLYELNREQLLLDQREQQLEQEVARASSTAQLARAARRLGLERAEELSYLRLPEGVVVGEPVPVPGEVGASNPPAGG